MSQTRKFWNNLVQSNSVWKLCAVGAIAPLIAATYNWRIQVKLQQQPYYQEALSKLSQYQSAVKHLGEPIKGQRVQRGYGSNTSITELSAVLDIPVKGTKGTGMLQVHAEKTHNRWEIVKMKITIDSINKSWTCYESKNTCNTVCSL